MSDSFAQLFTKSLSEVVTNPGEIIKGTVVSISSKHVLVNANLKSESSIPIEQFKDYHGDIEVKVGDVVEVVLDMLEDGFGETLLSRDKAKKFAEWMKLESMHQDGSIISVRVSGRVKGGFTVEIGALKGFLPGSLVDVRPVRDTSFLEGKEVDVKIIKMDKKRNNVVVSRRAVLETDNSEERAAIMEQLEEGKVVKGVVKNLTDYGAFIDLGGVDGLLHITDMSWKRVKHPSEILTIGQELEVAVLKIDRDKNRVSLGLKQMDGDPWAEILNRFPVNSQHHGKVTSIADYGCFVELESGVEGLVHVSEMDWTNKNINPNKIVHIGDEVTVMILDIDQERRRISLGIKQCLDNPWKNFSDQHQKGEKIKGNIKSITDFGIFIGLEGNIDGLVHLSDISWDKAGEEAIRDYTKGQEVETVILAIDAERERISLGIKQLEETPFTAYIEANKKGDVVKGTVIELEDKKAVIDLGHEVIGHLRSNEITKGKSPSIQEHMKIGSEVEAQITSFDNKARIVNLSIKAMDKNDTKPKGKGNDKVPEMPTATFADLFKEQLNPQQ
jgi:small subunit ribosomal protein S1